MQKVLGTFEHLLNRVKEMQGWERLIETGVGMLMTSLKFQGDCSGPCCTQCSEQLSNLPEVTQLM
jgi:hypothetical protein